MTPAAGATASRPTTRRQRAAPTAPRRVSGPVRGRVSVPAVPAAGPSTKSALASALAVRMRALPDTALIDRLLRGRAWIPVLGILLAGIVAMQVEVLKLGTSMGRWLEQSQTLTARNESLRASVAELGDDQRIESLAGGMGMVMPAPTELQFLTPHARQVPAAVANIHSPQPTQFLASLPYDSSQPSGGSASPGESASSGGGDQGSGPTAPTGAQSTPADASPSVSAASLGTTTAPSTETGSADGGQATGSGSPGSGATGPASAGPASTEPASTGPPSAGAAAASPSSGGTTLTTAAGG